MSGCWRGPEDAGGGRGGGRSLAMKRLAWFWLEARARLAPAPSRRTPLASLFELSVRYVEDARRLQLGPSPHQPRARVFGAILIRAEVQACKAASVRYKGTASIISRPCPPLPPPARGGTAPLRQPQHHDLPRRPAPRPDRRADADRRRDRRGFVPGLGRAAAGATLRQGEVVVDNSACTRGRRSAAPSHKAGAHLLFLPAYSLDLNPLEKVFAKFNSGAWRLD
jgi:hypothetical protein